MAAALELHSLLLRVSEFMGSFWSSYVYARGLKESLHLQFQERRLRKQPIVMVTEIILHLLKIICAILDYTTSRLETLASPSPFHLPLPLPPYVYIYPTPNKGQSPLGTIAYNLPHYLLSAVLFCISTSSISLPLLDRLVPSTPLPQLSSNYKGLMELGLISVAILGALLSLKWVLGNLNSWLYETKLGYKRFPLPPGDLGWPFLGNMWSFLRAFKSSNPDQFISTFVTRFGSIGVYRALMFGNPSIIVTTPEACKRVLLNDDAFKPGWPSSTVNLIGEKSFVGISYEEHKRLHKLTSAPINGHEALSTYIPFIENNVVSALEKWAGMGEIEFLTKIRSLTFRIIMYIFLSTESEQVMEALEREYTTLNYGVRAMAINIPGFAYHNALKARKKLVAVFQSVVDERRKQRKITQQTSKRDMMDALLEVEDENGRRLSDEEIIDILVMYLNAGHESSGHITMWATLFLQEHPEIFKKAKAEQEAIVKNRPATQKGLTLKEYRQMEYLSKVEKRRTRLSKFR